mmetsp:Transcript_130577/g.418670  ORF Transcript_130577/g.418670 Transcript_130577/m.418670 type:complete len:246 (+) Transcript_130577:701-1438(+)
MPKSVQEESANVRHGADDGKGQQRRTDVVELLGPAANAGGGAGGHGAEAEDGLLGGKGRRHAEHHRADKATQKVCLLLRIGGSDRRPASSFSRRRGSSQLSSFHIIINAIAHDVCAAVADICQECQRARRHASYELEDQQEHGLCEEEAQPVHAGLADNRQGRRLASRDLSFPAGVSADMRQILLAARQRLEATPAAARARGGRYPLGRRRRRGWEAYSIGGRRWRQRRQRLPVVSREKRHLAIR